MGFSVSAQVFGPIGSSQFNSFSVLCKTEDLAIAVRKLIEDATEIAYDVADDPYVADDPADETKKMVDPLYERAKSTGIEKLTSVLDLLFKDGLEFGTIVVKENEKITESVVVI